MLHAKWLLARRFEAQQWMKTEISHISLQSDFGFMNFISILWFASFFLLGFWWNDFEKIVVDRPRKVQKVTEGGKCGKFDACIIWPFSWELMMSVEWMSFGACWSGIFLISSLVFSHVFISVQRPAKLFHAVYTYHYAEGC